MTEEALEAKPLQRDLEEELASGEATGKTFQLAKASAFETAAHSAKDMELDPTKFKWKVFLAGPSGSGKTTAAAMTLPGRKLLVDFDNRADAAIGVPNLDIYPCHEPEPKSPAAWQKAERMRTVIIAEIRQGIFPYDSVIFDGLTTLGRIGMNWALTLDGKRGLGGSPAKQHYGPQMDNLAKFILSTITLPVHICYTGHIELIGDESTGVMRNLPKITGKLRTEASNWFNETYYCYRQADDKGKLSYFWQTKGSGRNEFFKSTLNQLGKYWEDPIQLDFESDGPVGFADLFERRFARKV